MEEKSEPPPSYNEVQGQQFQQGGYYPQGEYQQPGQQNPQQGGYYPQQGQYPQQMYGGQQQPVVTTQPTTIIINPGPLPNPPSDHLAYAIFVTICCCWPIGIFAILKSMECRDAISRGDANIAALKSREAKKFGNITLGVGLVMACITVAIAVIYVVFIVSISN